MSALSDAFYDWMRAVRELREAMDSCRYDVAYFTTRERQECARAERVYLDQLRKALAVEES